MNNTAAYKGIMNATQEWHQQKLRLVDPMFHVVREMFWRGNGYCPDMPFKLTMSDLAPFPIQWQRNRDKAE